MKTSWAWQIAFAVFFIPGFTTADEADSPDAAVSAPAEGQPAANAERLRQIIAEVRKAEDRYRDLETVVRINWQDEAKAAADPQDRLNVAKEEETWYTLQQGELFRFERRQQQTLVSQESIVTEQLAAFDGKTTRNIIYDNCVNVFDGRHEPSQLYPPHVWGLYPQQINFPLSVYLQGAEAIKKHPKAFQSPIQRGRVFEIIRVEVAPEGDEIVDGLKCVKLRCRRWSRDGDSPVTAEIWLAIERNYLCAKSVAFFGDGGRLTPYNQAEVKEWTKLAEDLWLPKRIEMIYFDIRGAAGKNAAVRRRDTLVVEKAILDPGYPASLFSDLDVPEDLPVYKIDRNGFLEGSGVRSAKAPANDPQELARIIDELRKQESRYKQFEVSLETDYRTFAAHNMGMPGLYLSSHETERTVLLSGKLYSERQQKAHTVAMGDPLTREKGGWDGQWIRTLYWRSEKGDLPAAPMSAALRKGGPKGLNAFRPHTALFSDWRMRSRPLSDFLTAEYWDETNKYRYRVDYLGEETVNELECAKLRLGFMAGQQTEPSNGFYFLWLAKDRNYLPVRAEHCDLSHSDRLPTSTANAKDLRELEPGLWFPFHVVETAYDSFGRDGLGSGQLVVNWRNDRRLASVDLAPKVPEELFAPSAPAGTTIYVSDESGHSIGQIRQIEDGPPQVSEEKLLAMAESARADVAERKQRQAAMDAIVGMPLAEFPEATWLNSAPLSKKLLAGKVLLIDFWAEWCGPCRADLERLGKIDRELAEDGVTLIGVHTAGSEKQEVAALAKELGLDYPIYLDSLADRKNGWGQFCGKLAVRELPHAFVVDRQGNIVAHGRLDEMISRASALAAQK